MHTFEILSFEDGRSPQVIVGTGGTKLDATIKRRLEGTKLGGTVVSHGRALHEYGFIMLMPRRDASGWTATFVTGAGRAKLACAITPAQAWCGRPGVSRPLRSHCRATDSRSLWLAVSRPTDLLRGGRNCLHVPNS
jgi:hypothetical protein